MCRGQRVLVRESGPSAYCSLRNSATALLPAFCGGTQGVTSTTAERLSNAQHPHRPPRRSARISASPEPPNAASKTKTVTTYYYYYVDPDAPSEVARRQANAKTFDQTQYYERDSRKIPFGTAEWWRQMEREGGGRTSLVC